MQVLHVHWLAPRQPDDVNGLFLWAETAGAGPPNRDRRKKSAQPHPFAASTGELSDLLAPVFAAGKRQTHSLKLWLPTNYFGPVPAPELLHDWEQDDGPPELLPWTLAGFLLPAADALRFLAMLANTDLPYQARLGSDGRFWQSTFTFTLEILARQLLRPILFEIRNGDLRYEARWQPVLDGEDDAHRVAQLAAAMPAICRADAGDPNDTLPVRAVLDTFLNHIVDAAARQWGARQDLYLPTGKDPASAWLRALFANDPFVEGSSAQLQHFATSYRAWERALTIAGDRHYRVAFRLEAPIQQEKPPAKKGEASWQLHYLLQARDDATLIVPATEVWQTRRGVLQALGRHFDRPQERLLTGLGYAERFDEDPFLLFRLRGKSQDEILTSLGQAAGPTDGEQPVYAPAPPLAESLDNFWQVGPELEQFHVHVARPETSYPLLERLGDPDFLPDARRWLTRAYDAVSATAVQEAFNNEQE